MIMATTDFTQYLKGLFPTAKFYTGSINKAEDKCIGVYAKGNVVPNMSLGGSSSTSSNTLPLSLLIHWTESAIDCEVMANAVYNALFGLSDISLQGRRVVCIEMLDSCPVNVDRDLRNIVEMVIRINIIYER